MSSKQGHQERAEVRPVPHTFAYAALTPPDPGVSPSAGAAATRGVRWFQAACLALPHPHGHVTCWVTWLSLKHRLPAKMTRSNMQTVATDLGTNTLQAQPHPRAVTALWPRHRCTAPGHLRSMRCPLSVRRSGKVARVRCAGCQCVTDRATVPSSPENQLGNQPRRCQETSGRPGPRPCLGRVRPFSSGAVTWTTYLDQGRSVRI